MQHARTPLSSPSSVPSLPHTCQHCVEELSVRLLSEPPEGCVGYPLHDALVEDAPHLRMVLAFEIADEDPIASRALPGTGGPHGQGLALGPRYGLVFVRNDFSLANHFFRRRRTMHANQLNLGEKRKNEEKGKKREKVKKKKKKVYEDGVSPVVLGNE